MARQIMSKDPKEDHAATPPEGEVYHQRFAVSFDYPVHFARGVFAPGNNLLENVLRRHGEDRVHKVKVFADQGLVQAQPELLDLIKAYFHARTGSLEFAGAPEILPGGEPVKNGWKTIGEVIWTLGNLHLDRQSYVIGVGGGAFLDMLGLATSLVHRGLRLIRIPSTVLAQCDAGIGVKNGMDEHGMKNFVGTFAPPSAVINDLDLLKTLSQCHWVGGVAEAFKVAIIKDAAFFDFLCKNAQAIRARDTAVMEQVIRRCAVIHLDHIRTGGDPFEFGSARPLDFGHWSSHRIECMSQYRVGHGQAVAIGIAMDSHYAMQLGLITGADFERIVSGLTGCDLPVWDACLDERNSAGELVLLDGLEQFREHLGGRLTVTLPDGIGKRREVHHMDVTLIEKALANLRTRT
jgi:3-dehydroquinate synthase